MSPSPACRMKLGFSVWVAFFLLVAVPVSLPVSSSQAMDEKSATVGLINAIQLVAKSSIPAVVHVEVTEQQEVANPFGQFGQEPFFRHFFGLPKNMPKKFKRELQGLGSGVIIDPKGYILTNNHVVGGATKISVELNDGRVFSGQSVKVVGKDPRTDLAVIRIESKEPLPYLVLGDSDKVAVGQWVVAIGQPRGLSESVTQGIISAKNRRGITDPSSYQDFLQTDAAINPGNSGGPLLDLDGRVIGINSAIASDSGGFEGIGFAIPSNMAEYVVKQLIATGEVKRGWIGVTIQDLTPELVQSMKLETRRGALVADVIGGGPADKAGLKRGDVVIEYRGKEIQDSGAFQNEVAMTQVGQDASLTVRRNGKKDHITVRIDSMEKEKKMVRQSLKRDLGITVRALTSKEADKYELDSQTGVMITSVQPNSPFARAGFEKGDTILEIDGNPVNSPEELDTMARSIPQGRQVTVLAIDHKSRQAGYVRMEFH